MSSEERYLIVSLGSIGRRHLRNLRALRPHASIALLRQYARETDASKPDEADAQFFTMDDALAFDPRAAIVAGPSPSHVTAGWPLAKAGVHLLLEKPIAAELAGLAEFIAYCRQRRLVLMTAYNLRFLPSLRRARELLLQGAIGVVFSAHAEVGQYLPDWRIGSDYRKGVSAQRSLGGGVLLELSHEFDYVYGLFGMPVRIAAMAGRFGDLDVDVETLAEVIMEYENPARFISIHLDMLQRVPVRQCRFVGSVGTLSWNGITDRIEISRGASSVPECESASLGADRNQMYLDELAHFLDCIEHGKAPLVDGVDGYNVLAMVAASKQSVAEGRAIATGAYADV